MTLAASNPWIADRRRRNLAILGSITALFLLLAALSVFERARELAPKFEPRPFFTDLAQQVNGLADVAITTKSGTFHVKMDNGKWIIPEKGGFPADAQQVRAVAAGFAGLEALDMRTARADWHSYLGLVAPDKGGDASEVKLSDASGKVLADLLIGHTEGNADELGRTSVYVRRPTENQTWLARGYIAPKTAAADWLDKGVLNIARDRVKGATITPATGPSYTLVRDNKDAPDFKLVDLPKGRSLSFEGAPDGVAGAIVGFTFDDVMKAGDIDFSKASQSVTNTFDGLDLTTKIAVKGMDHWATVNATATNPMVQAEATAINGRVGGWAFKLPDFKVTQFTATRDSLLKSPDEGKPAAPPSAPGK
ncbi:MAG TPA: DUF4340 domain-containing protein [Micropepsaceae bacterium]|nr:DUF4340 domain-containing protein [Micropepsaceae bacterium]